ncbi:MAG TPA: hypothetical protein VMH22_09250 [bacterium]|nr:hypothetical protein [bacterium]
MLIKDILRDPIAARRYMERYVNDGSPSGFTWMYNTSVMTNPRGPATAFNLYAAKFAKDMLSDYGDIPGFFGDAEILLHPDMAENELVTSCCESIRVSDFCVLPTSSSRTVEILNPDRPGYVKLNYKGLIGRIDRQITRNHAISSVELTEIIRKAVQASKLPRQFLFLEEPGARVVSLPTKTGKYEWGMVYREATPFPRPNKLHVGVPAFSLFSKDIKHEEDPPLLVQLVNSQNKAPDDYLFESIISPLIVCHFELLLNCALELEFHAQNALIGLNSDCMVVGIVIRDLESVDKDLSLAEDLHINAEFRSAPYKCIQRGQYNYNIKHSFMFDFKLGEYFITPLIEVIRQHFGVDSSAIIERTRELSRSYISRLPPFFFPADGNWYCYENIVLDRTKKRPYLARANPKYR